jgi:hypothetical protein
VGGSRGGGRPLAGGGGGVGGAPAAPAHRPAAWLVRHSHLTSAPAHPPARRRPTPPQPPADPERAGHWRRRRAIASQLPALSAHLTRQQVAHCIWPVLVTLMQDPVAAVRCEAARQVGPVLALLPDAPVPGTPGASPPPAPPPRPASPRPASPRAPGTPRAGGGGGAAAAEGGKGMDEIDRLCQEYGNPSEESGSRFGLRAGLKSGLLHMVGRAGGGGVPPRVGRAAQRPAAGPRNPNPQAAGRRAARQPGFGTASPSPASPPLHLTPRTL